MTDSDINAYLDNKGIRHDTIGRAYLMKAIRYCLDNPDCYSMMIIYDTIGDTMFASASGVERCIRHAIQRTGAEVNNKEFVFRAADDLRYKSNRP